MIHDRGDFALLRIPSLWGSPRFEFGQSVSFEGNQGIVTGLNYIPLGSYPNVDQNCDPGWWVEITYEPTAKRARTYPVEWMLEGVVQESNSGDTSVELSSDQRHTANSLCCVEGS